LFNEVAGQGKTLIVVTHNKELAACSPRVIEVQDGKISRDECRAAGVQPSNEL
jgi:ABC-type lipoprotein export system ATPase subunit